MLHSSLPWQRFIRKIDRRSQQKITMVRISSANTEMNEMLIRFPRDIMERDNRADVPGTVKSATSGHTRQGYKLGNMTTCMFLFSFFSP